jgi:hypothetical protein
MNMIKTLKATLAISLLAGATIAQAAPYTVQGTLTGFSTTPSIITAAFTPTAPTFTGNWDIDSSSISPVGDVSFAPYTAQWSVLGLPSGTTNYTTDNYHLDTTGVSVGYNYDVDTRTLTITNALLASTGSANSCSGSAFICGNELPSFQLNLTLTFADNALSAFSGTATAINDDGNGSSYAYDWAFNGQAAPTVPAPAALWLFGSGLVGLAGVARSRKNV